MDTFNTFSYQPLLARAFSSGSEFPPDIVQAVKQNPDKAGHIQSVWQFAEWMKTNEPALYGVVASRRPELLDAPDVVTGGQLGGMGQAADAGGQGVLTQWGTQMLDLAKGYMVYDAQKDLMALNISRAERGLPPIDPGVIAPQVQVGIAGNVQTLMYIALAGLVLVGLLAVFKRGK
jgi:hypothetical protein